LRYCLAQSLSSIGSTVAIKLSFGGRLPSQDLLAHVFNFDIPEVDLLQKELDFHAKWTADVAQSVGIQPKQVTGFLNNLLRIWGGNRHDKLDRSP
jgi:hypothetical protein